MLFISFVNAAAICKKIVGLKQQACMLDRCPLLPPCSFRGWVSSFSRVDAVWRRSTPGFTHRARLGLA
jgi:hypothetical protein